MPLSTQLRAPIPIPSAIGCTTGSAASVHVRHSPAAYAVGQTYHTYAVGQTCHTYAVGQTCHTYAVGQTCHTYAVGQTYHTYAVGQTCHTYAVGQTCHTYAVGQTYHTYAVGQTYIHTLSDTEPINEDVPLRQSLGGARIAQWLEHRTRDWKAAGSNPCWNGGRIFFSRVDFTLCWLLFRYPFHPRVTTVARKKSRSFCQKCRWQVTAKHAYTLRMWILLNRASALVTTCP